MILISLFILIGIFLISLKFDLIVLNQLTKSHKIHFTILAFINFMIIAKSIVIAWEGNDKGIILVIFVYFTLLILNGLVWLILKILKKPENKIYKMMTICLVILLIPSLILASIY